MTTPANDMNLADTMANVTKLDAAMKSTDAEMKKAYDMGADGREIRRSLHAIREKLQSRRDALNRSMNHGERMGREFVSKGNDRIDLGPVR